MVEDVKVLIVGAGAAGLSAAAALEPSGVSWLVLEAQSRIGGRVHSVAYAGQVPFERGAQMINGDMTAVLELSAQEKLHVSPVPSTGCDLCYVGGDVLPRTDLVSAEDLENLMNDAIRSKASAPEIVRSLGSLYRWWKSPWEDMGELRRGLALAATRIKPPKDSLGAAIQRLLLCPEDEAIARTKLAEQYGADPDAMSTLAVKTGLAAYASERGDAEFQFPAGMSRIVEAIASKLSRQPVLNMPVSRISCAPEGLETATKGKTYHKAQAIVAVPPTIAHKIQINVPDHAALDRLLSAFSAGDMIKTRLVYDRPFWRHKGYSGAITFASPAGLEVRDTSYDTGGNPQLTAFLGGPVARKRANLSKDHRQALLLGDIARVLGDPAGHPVDVDEALWVEHPWSGGGYNAYVRHDQPPDTVQPLAHWQGSVQFAGAELDDIFAGYVEGAIRSGCRVAARIVRALKMQGEQYAIR